MEVKPKLNLWDIFCIATGAMISSGLFVLPAIAYRYSGPSIIIAYVLAGLLMIPSIFSKSELITAMPKSGGTYYFIDRSFGPFLGIFSGLTSWFSLSLKSAFALIGIGAFLEYFLPQASTHPQFYFFVKLIAVSFCVVFVVINVFSVKFSARIQNLMVIFLVLSCLSYVLVGIYGISFKNFQPFFRGQSGSLLPVIGLVFVSYGGLTKVASIAEETQRPYKTIPQGMFLSFFVVQIIYVGCVAVTIGLLPANEMAATLTPLTHGGLKIGGLSFGLLMSAAAMVAFITTANSGILSSSRVPLAMSRDELLPAKFSYISKQTGMPYFSIIFTGLFMVIIIIFLDLENLVKTASTLMIMLFMFVNLAVIIMRESKIINYRPTFRSPLYPWLQAFAIVSYGFLIFEMGKTPLIISVSFVVVSLLWFWFSAPHLQRQSALMHLVERITAREFADTSLEEELKDILHKRDNIVKDRFDHLIERCLVFDIKNVMSRDDFFEVVSLALAPRLDVEASQIKELLIEREEDSHTVIDKGLAIPHIVVPGQNKFEIILVRARKGIIFSTQEDPVHIIFVLAGSSDERNFHLRVLMSIANIVREQNFHSQFMRVRNKESLRVLILSSNRKRHKKAFCLPEDKNNKEGVS